MKRKLILSCLLLSIAGVSAVEQELVPWNHPWKYFQTMSDDPSVDDPTIDDAGAGVAPTTGPDLIYTNFNGTTDPAGAWFATEANFTSATGYENMFGKGFGIDGPLVGDPLNNYSTYDGGEGPGPLGYDTMDYFGRGLELLTYGTTLTTMPANRRFAAYFRTTFSVAQDFGKPRVRMLLDDNAVIYIDGVLIAYVNRSNSAIAYADVGGTDTTATNNEEFAIAPANNNENVIQSFRLDQSGGPGVNTLTAGSMADSFVVTPLPKLLTGTHTIAIMVRNSGNNSSDRCLALQLLGDDAGISAIVNSTTRQPGADPIDPADDTFTASVTVTKLGSPSTEWTSDVAPSAPGPYSYDVAYPFGPFPASASQVVNFTATGDPALTASVTLTAPIASAVVGTNSLAGDPVIRISTAYSPWTQMPGLPADRRIQLNNGNALGGINTDPIALTPGTPKCVIMSLDYNDNSAGSNAEVGDSIKVELVTDAGTVNLTAEYDLDGTSTNNGRAMNGEDDDQLTPSDELNPDNLPENYTFTAHWLLAGVIPSSATTVQVRISAVNDSGSEFLRIGNIQLRPCIDTDEDGVLDIFEEVQGTDSNDENSYFREISHSRSPGSASITVTTSTTRTYAFESSTDLLFWTRDALPGTPPGLPFLANEPGTGGNLTLTRTNADPERLFWRARVHLPTTDIVSP